MDILKRDRATGAIPANSGSSPISKNMTCSMSLYRIIRHWNAQFKRGFMLQNFFLRHLQYNQQARRFFMTIVALGFVIDGVYAVLLNLYMLRLGYDTQFIGQINSAGLMAFALMSLPAGLFGARWSSGRMLGIGLGAILLGTGLLPMVEFIPVNWRAGWLMLTYSMTLAGFSLYFVNGAPFLMSAVTPQQQNSAFALQTALLALAAFVGSLLGGNLPALIAQFFEFGIDHPVLQFETVTCGNGNILCTVSGSERQKH